MTQYGMPTSASRPRAEVVNDFLRGVYAWMSGGLLLTAGVAWATVTIQPLFAFAVNAMIFLILAELGLVFFLSMRIRQMSPSTATGAFLGYSALNGLTLAPILMLYTQQSVAATFVVAAGMFGAMSLYGLLTKKDLTSWGSLLFMGLIGIILASVVNIFMQSGTLGFVISGIGVLIFLGLTAYDTQRLKVMGETAPAGDVGALRKMAIMGALQLYLDFINLFLFLLRFMGVSRD
ncbi:Bax inhibitor-1/YccA family protein [Paucidesulfovibrio longus]|uniref:Bax inhibitor-1/YccA family protein n=1 Tax=Paucidesulfovibrio longus TaxID=889 RepID=UPI0003B747D9|nr:Bax inhibitor-1/YccA family protein [Paucidesulfovibrio longus]